MKRSINEISGMVLKAARGAGVPLGHCEDLAAAAGYLAATDPVALDCLGDVLAGPFTSPVVKTTGTLLQVEQGSVAMIAPLCVDALRSGYDSIVIKDCPAPQIIFALCAAQDVAVDHRFDGDQLTLTTALAKPIMPEARSVTVAQSLWDRLDALAAKTYVPATEASRLAGAGAGLTDND